MEQVIRNFGNYQLSYGIIKRSEKHALILLHGWLGSRKSLEQLGNSIRTDATIINVDLLGFGDSEIFNSYPQNLNQWLKLIENSLEEIIGKYQSVSIFGHSVGGAVAVSLATKFNEKVNKVVLCNSAIIREPRIHPIARMLKPISDSKAATKVKPYVMPLLRKTLFRSSDSFRYPEMQELYRSIVTTNLLETAVKLDCETLLIWGELDTSTPLSQGKRLYEAMKRSALQICEGYGHNLPLINPKLVASYVDKFIH